MIGYQAFTGAEKLTGFSDRAASLWTLVTMVTGAPTRVADRDLDHRHI